MDAQNRESPRNTPGTRTTEDANGDNEGRAMSEPRMMLQLPSMNDSRYHVTHPVAFAAFRAASQNNSTRQLNMNWIQANMLAHIYANNSGNVAEVWGVPGWAATALAC